MSICILVYLSSLIRVSPSILLAKTYTGRFQYLIRPNFFPVVEIKMHSFRKTRCVGGWSSTRFTAMGLKVAVLKRDSTL